MAESPHSEHECAPLRIFVVGAELGGLAAAVSVRRQGHRVEIFKSSLMNREIGAAITMQANAMRVPEYLGYEERTLKGVEFFGTVRFSGSRGEGQTNLFLIPRNYMGRISRGGNLSLCLMNCNHCLQAGWLCHRTDLHDDWVFGKTEAGHQ
ncbi:hypothetical protein DFH09DRAFT_1280923 [Mycena vulgaris]|nr:hypothetical protein DFH09DRAFT_1280923 [Mycena vulgaris]